jgi:hypothetical protein
MRSLIAAALELGWTVVPYEAKLDRSTAPGDWEEINRREDEQARNLVGALDGLDGDARLLVWCGNSHLSRYRSGDWYPMGLRFAERAGFEAFAIDQAQGVGGGERSLAGQLVERHRDELVRRGGTAGFLAEDQSGTWFGVDAVLLSTENDLS